MSIFSRGSKGIVAAMRFSYQKHVNLARRGKAGAPSDPPHLTGLFGALATRNNVCGIQGNEVTIWLELTPFIHMEEEQAVSLLCLYAAYRELPLEIPDETKNYLFSHINTAALTAFEKDPSTIRSILAQQYNFLWTHILTDATRNVFAEPKVKSLVKEPDVTEERIHLGTQHQQALWNIAVNDYYEILNAAQKAARLGITPPTVEGIFKAYLELAVFYMSTICVLISMTFGETVEHEIEELLKSALVSLDAEDPSCSWDRQENLFSMFNLLETRRPQYRQFYQTPDLDTAVLVKMISGFLMESGKGHAVVYGDEVLSETIHSLTAPVVHLARETYRKFTVHLDEFKIKD